MWNLKKLRVIALFMPIQLISMVQSPKQSYITQLPPELRHQISQYALHGSEYPDLHALANTLIAMGDVLTADRVIEIFKSLPYTVNAIDLARHLKDLPVIKDDKIQNWLKQASKHLQDGQRLFDAVKANNIERVDQLLKNHDIELNWQTSFYAGQNTSLIEAVQKNSSEIVQRLLKAGANPNLRNSKDQTALIIAASTLPVRLFIQVNAPQEVDYYKGLAKKRNEDILAMLLKAGAKPNMTGPGDSTALMAATAVASANIVKMLLDAGADPDLKDMHRRSVIDYLYDAALNNYSFEERSRVKKMLEDASAMKSKSKSKQ